MFESRGNGKCLHENGSVYGPSRMKVNISIDCLSDVNMSVFDLIYIMYKSVNVLMGLLIISMANMH